MNRYLDASISGSSSTEISASVNGVGPSAALSGTGSMPPLTSTPMPSPNERSSTSTSTEPPPRNAPA